MKRAVLSFSSSVLCLIFLIGVLPSLRAANALHEAAKVGDLETVRNLVGQGGIDIDRKDADGVTPLMEACFYNHPHVVQFLCDNEASVHPTDDGSNPLIGACQSGNVENVRILIEHGANAAGDFVLKSACSNGRLDMVQYLVEHGADVNGGDDDGTAPLGAAVQNEKLDLMRWLITQGAQVNTDKPDAFTVLHEACRCGDINAVKFLCEQGADINSVCSGVLPVEVAVGDYHNVAIELLNHHYSQAPEVFRDVLLKVFNRLGALGAGTLYACALQGSSSGAFRVLHELIYEQERAKFDTSASFAHASRAGNYGPARYLFSLGVRPQIFGENSGKLVDLEQCANARVGAMADSVLEMVFGHPYRALLHEHQEYDPESFKYIKTQALFERVKETYECHVWEVLPTELKVLILQAFLEQEVKGKLDLAPTQVCLLTLCVIHKDKKFDHLVNRYSGVDSRSIGRALFLMNNTPSSQALSLIGDVLLI